MQQLQFEHYGNRWIVVFDRDFDIVKAFCNEQKIKLTQLRSERIFNYIKKNKLFHAENLTKYGN